jgi:CRP-like cAMP-binding protein
MRGTPGMPKADNNALTQTRYYRPNEVIVTEGASPDCFFVILQGTVEIFQNEVSVRILTEGDVFGLENHYLHRPYTTSAKALTRARISAYAAALIREIVFDSPQLTEKILSSIVRQLEQTTETAALHIPSGNVTYVEHAVFYDGDSIIREDTVGTDIFRLVQSERGLRITRRNRELSMICTPGEIFGEVGAFLGTPHTTTVSSCGKSVVEKFSAADLETFTAEHPGMCRSIICALAARLRDYSL